MKNMPPLISEEECKPCTSSPTCGHLVGSGKAMHQGHSPLEDCKDRLAVAKCQNVASAERSRKWSKSKSTFLVVPSVRLLVMGVLMCVSYVQGLY